MKLLTRSVRNMQSFTAIVVLTVVLVVVYSEPEDGNMRQIFRECAEANGFKPDPEKFKQMKESLKNGEKPQIPPNGFSEEFLCTQKCVQERIGAISDGKYNVDKVKETKMLMHHIEADKVDAFLKCLQEIEITKCSDMMKFFECGHASM